MAMPPVDQIVQKWVQRAGAARGAFEAGIRNVRESPGPKAAAKADLWIARCQEAHRSGKFAAQCRKLDLGEWQRVTLAKGAARYAAGVQDAQPKFLAFMQEFAPHIEAGLQLLRQDRLKRGDLDQNITRMTEMIRHLAKFRKGNAGGAFMPGAQ